jgi:hypothetical protein
MVPFHWLALNASQRKYRCPLSTLKARKPKFKTDPYKVSDMDEAGITVVQVMLSFQTRLQEDKE